MPPPMMYLRKTARRTSPTYQGQRSSWMRAKGDRKGAVGLSRSLVREDTWTPRQSSSHPPELHDVLHIQLVLGNYDNGVTSNHWIPPVHRLCRHVDASQEPTFC